MSTINSFRVDTSPGDHSSLTHGGNMLTANANNWQSCEANVDPGLAISLALAPEPALFQTFSLTGSYNNLINSSYKQFLS